MKKGRERNIAIYIKFIYLHRKWRKIREKSNPKYIAKTLTGNVHLIYYYIESKTET